MVFGARYSVLGLALQIVICLVLIRRLHRRAAVPPCETIDGAQYLVSCQKLRENNPPKHVVTPLNNKTASKAVEK